MRLRTYATLLTICTLLVGCQQGNQAQTSNGRNAQGHSPATPATIESNTSVIEQLPLADVTDFENANRGLIAQSDSLVVKAERTGEAIWNQDQFDFISGDAPESVNPSLWRQAKLNSIHGLFKVTDRIYQIRGYDLANMSVLLGDTGLIIVDPLTVTETAAEAMRMVREHLGDLPIKAIIYTHSHIDHFGGVNGVISAEDARRNQVQIIAPAGFSEEATSENVLAGIAMQRRASYQYGARLARNERGHVDLGLGKEVPFGGEIGFLEPTVTVDTTGTELTIDGLRFQFQFTPGSEAPSEFTFYLPELNAFCGAEVVSQTMHNIYTLRGAKVRDSKRWSDYINEAIDLFGQADVYFASHHWPLWGNENIREFLTNQRDGYKYIHDQTLRLANQGFTSQEIAETIQLPEKLQQSFANRGYYGTLKHNAKAVYQFYFGWYDGNPANLDPLPPEPVAKKYVDAIGGSGALLEKAQKAYDSGEYRWTAELLKHLVFAQPSNQAGRSLLADTYDQLGYQAESGPWRSVYLSGAYELRHGGPTEGINMTDTLGLLEAIEVDKLFDSMAARLNPEKVAGKTTQVVIHFTDLNETYTLWLSNSVLHHKAGGVVSPDAEVSLTHDLFLKMATGEAGLKDTLFSDDLELSGSRLKLLGLLGAIEKPEGTFAIVTPE